MRHLLGFIVAVSPLLSGPARSEADMFDLSGTFGGGIQGTTTGVEGGSFSGTFSATNLPNGSGGTPTVDSFDISLFDSSHNFFATFDSTTAGSTGTFTFNASYVLLSLGYMDSTMQSPSERIQFRFAAGFDGTGAVVPSTQQNGSYYVIYTNPAVSTAIASGVSGRARAVVAGDDGGRHPGPGRLRGDATPQGHDRLTTPAPPSARSRPTPSRDGLFASVRHPAYAR